MEQTKLDHLIDSLLSATRKYGLSESRMEKYHAVCSSILKFAATKGDTVYSEVLMDEYAEMVKERYSQSGISSDYLKTQKRVIRMLNSLDSAGYVDFSIAKNRIKYKVSHETACLVTDILDENKLLGGARSEMDTVIRHFFFYADTNKVTVQAVSDSLFMEFLTVEAPTTNQSSIGRALRAVKLISAYLKSRGRTDLILDFSQLNIKTGSTKIILPYTQTEISRILNVVDRNTLLGLRDYAILLLGFDTGLRGVDIRTLCLSDIDWKKARIKVNQCKTSRPLILPLSGKAMNAIADYILVGRPDCDFQEIFLTARTPIRPMGKRYRGFSKIMAKYSRKAEVEMIPMRSFHSLRRSYATELSIAGVSLETISQLLGHKRIEEDKPYLSYNHKQAAFCSMDFGDIPLEKGFYALGLRGGE